LTPRRARDRAWSGGTLAGVWLRDRRSGYLPDGTHRLLEAPAAEAMTVEDLQGIADRLVAGWGVDAPKIAIDASVAGQIGRVTQLRGRTTMVFEPAVLALAVTDAEVAVGHELGHLVHPAVPGSSLDGWRRAAVVLAAVAALSFPFSFAWAPLLAVSAATEIVTAIFVIHWAPVARIQRRYEFFADQYSAERLGAERVASYLSGWVQAREPHPPGRRLALWLNRVYATHPSIPERVSALRALEGDQ